MKILRPLEVTDARLSAINLVEDELPVYDPSAPYTAGERVQVGAGVHRRYEALIDVTGKYPPDHIGGDTPAWLELGATNPWAMFDNQVATATEGAAAWTAGGGRGIQFEIQPGQIANAVALLNVYAASVRVEVLDPSEGVVYDATRSLTSALGITDWYSWFFEPIERMSDVVFLDLPSYGTAQVRVSLHEPTGNARCGLAVLGSQKEIGGTHWGASVGITDYSRKERDVFGRPTIVSRDYSKRASLDVGIVAGRVDYVQRLLAGYRTTPLIWVGTEQYASTLIYGYYRDFDIVISNHVFSECSIEIEGLT
jgi:hypothetical protein